MRDPFFANDGCIPIGFNYHRPTPPKKLVGPKVVDKVETIDDNLIPAEEIVVVEEEVEDVVHKAPSYTPPKKPKTKRRGRPYKTKKNK